MEKWPIAYIASWAFLLSLLQNFVAQGLTDNRCYLENGASGEDFFVPEDLPIGSFIGQVRVHGDPRPGGNINLHFTFHSSDSPVSITPGTKNLTLKKRLDKEGKDGPSSVFVTLQCQKLDSLDSGFPTPIPINLRVTDVNDNSPVFNNVPYALNISEVTVVGTRVLHGVNATDRDQPGPYSSIKYSVLPGPYSDFFGFENELEGTLVLRKGLDYENLKTFNVQIRAEDHGEPPRTTDTILTVNVLDADDQNPRFQDDRYSVIVQGPLRKGSILDPIKPRDIKAFDQDQGINAPVFYTFNGIGSDFTSFKIHKKTGKISLAKDINEHDLTHPVTVVIRATQEDNPDRYALATLTISKNIGNGIQFLHEVFYITASESLPIGSVIDTLENNRPGEHLRYFVSNQNILKTFALNTKGELSLRKKLDYEERQEYVFKVFATDGITNDSSVINVTVEDSNEWEPRFRYPHYEFFAAGLSNELLGRIEAADGDKTDKITLTLKGTNASLFFVTSTYELRLRDSRTYNDDAHFDIVATDSGIPPKSTSIPVTVHFPGSSAGGISSSSRGSNGGPLLLAGLGAILLILAFVIAFLIAYICKAKRRPREELPTVRLDKSNSASLVDEKVNNPMFGERLRSPTAIAMGGVPTDFVKTRIPSPKVHPAPQPPAWPTATVSRVKKLSWGDDKTDSGSSDHLNNIDTTPKVLDNTNLTVYF